MIPTVSVTCESFDQNGNPIAGARFEAKLDRTEIYDGFVVPEKVTAIADTNGVCVLELWPNALGANASSYAIKAWNPDTGKRFIDTTAVVPNSDCRLEQIIVAEPYPALDAAQQALIAAQGALAPVTAQAQAAAASALVAQDAEDGALAAETAAQASAAAALASQQAAAISQTSALSSASTATGAAHTSTTAADAAVAARDVAQASATTATAQATAAGQSALAADASADAAAASQAAAAGSASTAQGHATAAAGSANTAQAEAAAALQAKAAAQTAATSAQTSAQQAEDAADSATGQAALAAAAVPTALGHANTAASHAATATTKAGEASASQTAAAASQAAAAASQSQASASASAAAVSASTAAVSAAQASVSADNAISLFGSLVDIQAAADESQASAIAAEVAVSNAQAQASLAAGYAASASSVVQQDLSGVNAAALHRSPNAVTALFVYDTSKDSDGGAWTEKCQHTSWYNEAINGKWLGARASEATARAVSGATTGDYFQLTTDGKFYRLWKNSLAGATVNPVDTSGLTLFGDAAATLTVVDDAAALAAAGLSNIASNAKVFRLNNTAGTTSAFVRFNYALTMGNEMWSFSAYVRGSGTSVIDINAGTWTGAGSTALTSAYQRQVSTGVTNTSSNQWRIRVGGGGDLYFIMMQAEVSATATAYESNTSTGSISEVFRGNKRDFPRLAAIVAEAANVTIYDLTEPGRPMWMRFITPTSVSGIIGWASNAAASIAGLSAVNGSLCIGGSGSTALLTCEFSRERVVGYSSSGIFAVSPSMLAQRNGDTSFISLASTGIANTTVNAVAMTVLPDAFVDPVTGLKVPTIAVATGGGVSVIQHSGVVRNSSSTGIFNSVSVDPYLLSACRSDGIGYFATDPGLLGAGFSMAQNWPADFRANQSNKNFRLSRERLASINFGRVSLNKAAEDTPARSVVATVANTFNTGHMVGDIRRAYLADVGAGSVTGPELVTNGTFDTDTTGWSRASGNATLSVVGGALRLTAIDTFTSYVVSQISVVAGRSYRFKALNTANSSSTASIVIGSTAGGSDIYNSGGSTGFITVDTVFLAPVTGTVFIGLRSGNTVGGYSDYDNISAKEVVADRSYKAQNASITGTLTKTAVASAAQLVAYSGFSAANYLREPYSADLDFGTGEWTCSAWANIPTTLPVESFPVIGSEALTNGDFSSGSTGWSLSGTDATHIVTFSGGTARYQSGTTTPLLGLAQGGVLTIGKTYLVEITVSSWISGSIKTDSFGSTVVLASGAEHVGPRKFVLTASDATFAIVRNSANVDITIDSVSIREVGAIAIFDRASSSSARMYLGITGSGRLTATAFDGTTTRTVTTAEAYNTATWLKARANYRAGRLSILVNGVEVAVTNGAPLLTLNNSNAVLTIGNSFALDAPFPGSIALLKFSATVPTAEQSVWMYEQEKQMFREGAQVCLPDSGAIVDLTYDDATDKWIAVSAANESEWSGLVRTSVTPVPAGSYTRAAASSGVQLLARSTTSPGVDVTIPAYGLREELVKRAEAAARINQDVVVFDFDTIGFTAAMTNGSNQVTASSITGTPFVGMAITGTGIPAGTTISGINGTTYTLSANATATGSNAVGQAGFDLPVGYTARVVYSAGTQRREGSTRDYTRLFDGFREQVRFAVTPGASTWVQIHAVKEAA